MSALIRYFLSKGKLVAGYDKTPSDLTKQLNEEGALIHYDDNVDLIPEVCRNPLETLVVYTPAVPSTHTELSYFQSAGFEVMKRARVLGEITGCTRGLCVAGTHGKTTTSSMIAHLLKQSHVGCNAFLGGILKNYDSNLLLSETSDLTVIEADEYDTAFFDKRSKFVHYRPRTAILNNLEFDHADIFPDLAAIETQFHHLVRTVPSAGRVIVHADHASLDRVLARGCWTPVERFGATGDWTLGTVEAEGRFTVCFQGQAVGQVNWALLGEHNRHNALAAIAAARHVGVPPAVAIEALSRFANVKRRMEVKGIAAGVTVYDDFAHHPTAILTTLNGLRAKVGTARVLAVLEPRSNTMKLGTMKAELPASLAAADHVFCYGAHLGWDAAAALAPLGDKATCFDDLEALVAAVTALAQPNDHVLVMSNGGFGGVHGKLLSALAAKV